MKNAKIPNVNFGHYLFVLNFFVIQISVRVEVVYIIISYEKCNFSNLAASSFVVGIHPGATLPGRRRRFLSIKAEVNYVNAEEAKKLITVEGFAVLDVRDNTQFKRAHIKDCFHVPLFIENNDKDLGKKYSCFPNYICSQLYSLSEI